MTTKVEEKVKEVEKEKPAKKDFEVRELTSEEKKILEEDHEPAAGYNNRIPVEVGKEKEEDPAKKPAEKEEKSAEKTEEKVIDKPKEETKEDFFDKLEREIAKPDGKEDLKEFTPREKAYFYRMRRDRKLRQKAESERDTALFNAARKKETPAKEEVETDPLKGKDDDDIITVKDVKEILKKPKVEDPESLKKPAQNLQLNYLKMCEKEARQTHADFDAVIELSDDLIVGNAEALQEVSERTQAGENPAIVMYELIKSHKDFETLFPAAEIKIKARQKAAEKPAAETPVKKEEVKTPETAKKEQEAKIAEKALEDNVGRTKTTAHISSREGKPAEELSIDEITSMSDLEFAKLPRHVRSKYLKAYGSAPARSPN